MKKSKIGDAKLFSNSTIMAILGVIVVGSVGYIVLPQQFFLKPNAAAVVLSGSSIVGTEPLGGFSTSDVKSNYCRNVYVGDLDYRVQKFTSKGSLGSYTTTVSEWGTRGSGNGQFESVTGIATDSTGNVYVSDTVNNRIQKFTSSGTFLTKWGTRGGGNGQFNSPTQIAIDSSGNVFVLDKGNQRVQKFTPSGTYLAKWGSSGSGTGQFDQPVGIAVDRAGNVFVSEPMTSKRIQKFSNTGAFLAQWGLGINGNSTIFFPRYVTADTNGNIFFSDASEIQKYTGNGTYLTKWGTQGSGDGQFNNQAGVAVDASNNVYVVDRDNNRIQKFDATGAYVGQWGSAGSGPWQFLGATEIAVNSCPRSRPDLAVVAIAFDPVTLKQSHTPQMIKYSFAVKNNSDVSVTLPATTKVTLRENTPVSQVLGDSQCLAGKTIAAGGIYNCTGIDAQYSGTVFANLGPITSTLSVDSSNVVIESDETNNTYSGNFTIIP